MEIIGDILLSPRFLGIKWLNDTDFFNLVIRFALNLVMAVSIVRGIYYPITRRRDYVFTFMMFSVIVFMVCLLLSSVNLDLGFALGLFAIFGIMRYRTDDIEIKEMTYLFIVVGVAVVNAMATKRVSHAELLFINLAILGSTYLLERAKLFRNEVSQNVTYEKIALIKPESRDELMADLRDRTGLDIHRVEIGRIDFLRDTASIRIFYYDDAR